MTTITEFNTFFDFKFSHFFPRFIHSFNQSRFKDKMKTSVGRYNYFPVCKLVRVGPLGGMLIAECYQTRRDGGG